MRLGSRQTDRTSTISYTAQTQEIRSEKPCRREAVWCTPRVGIGKSKCSMELLESRSRSYGNPSLRLTAVFGCSGEAFDARNTRRNERKLHFHREPRSARQLGLGIAAPRPR